MNSKKTELSKAAKRKVYVKPTLKSYGDVRDLTLAPSPGNNIESGRGINRRTGRTPTNP